MRPLIALCALYAAFMLGRWYAPRYDVSAQRAPSSAEWTGPEMESEVPYREGYEAGMRDGAAQCGVVAPVWDSEIQEVGYAKP